MVNVMSSTDRKVRKRAEREDRILKAAQELILAKGFANTTIDEIADKADVSKGAVYLHYRTKDDIYFSIVAKALETMRDMFVRAAEGKRSGLEKFRAIGYSFYEFTTSFPEYSSILYDANSPRLCDSLASEKNCQSLNDQIGNLMIGSIKTGIRDGSIRPEVDPTTAAMIISSSLQGLLKTLIAENETVRSMGLDEGQVVDTAIDLYGRSLMASNCASGDERDLIEAPSNAVARPKQTVRRSSKKPRGRKGI
jgi:TetR/AcrR family transcriptional regulator